MSEIEKFGQKLIDNLLLMKESLEKESKEWDAKGKHVVALGLRKDKWMLSSIAKCVEETLKEMKKNGS